MRQVVGMLQPPPQEALWRCNRHAGFRLHTASPWLEARFDDGHIAVRAPKQRFEFDFVIFGTGLVNDLASRPELAALADKVALWKDRYTPRASEEDEHLAHSPYLGPGFELTEKVAGTAPYLRRIHLFTHASMPSMGLAAASITGMKYGIRKLVAGVTRGLFFDEAEAQLQALKDYAELEIWTLDPQPATDDVPGQLPLSPRR
jgi:cation diffusion facilitator CzcD-associated flavoprotein CzcO